MKRFRDLPVALQIFFAAQFVVTMPAVWAALRQRDAAEPWTGLALIVLAVLFAAGSVELPIFQGRITLAFGIICLAQFLVGSWASVTAASLAAVVSTYARPSKRGFRIEWRRPPLHRAWFNAVNCAMACAAGTLVYAQVRGLPLREDAGELAAIAAFTTVYYLSNTLGLALALALTHGRRWLAVWRENFLWTAPGFYASASVAVGIEIAHRYVGPWALLLVPPLYLLYYWHRLYMDRLSLYAEMAERDRAQIQELSAENRDLVELNQAIVAASPLAVVALDPEGMVRSWNAAAERLFGWSADEVLGRPFPASLEGHDGLPLLLNDLARADETGCLEARVRRKDGPPVEISAYAAPLADRAGDSGLVALIEDATDRKLAEEALRRRHLAVLTEHSLDVILVLTPDGTVTYATPSLERIFGYDAGVLVGRSLVGIVHSEDQDAFRNGFSETVRSRAVSRGEARLRHEAGVWRRVEWTAVNLLEHPSVAGIALTCRDLTERMQLEEQLRQSQKMEAIGRLAGGVAHDFNNMLAVINGYSNLLLQGTAPDAPHRQGVEQILEAGQRAANLTRQLLAFSRRQMLTPQVLDLDEVLGSLERMLRRLIGEDVELVTRFASEGGRIRADAGQIEQVVMNLVVNARDAMPEGGRLTLRTSLVRRNGGQHVLLEVADTGCGMDQETAQRIFEPFFTTKEVGKGTGLGLATVYGIVQQSGGEIEVESRPGGGTRFEILFPTAAAGVEKPAASSEPEAHPSGSETVLLVEDEAMLRGLARRVLEMAGYQVLEAAHAEAALGHSSSHGGPVHLLITDVVLPRMNGRELARRIREQRPEVRVLYMSGYTDDEVVRHGISSDAAAFLQKPFSPALLTRKVREVLEAAYGPSGGSGVSESG